jgi:hypothetical protein
LLLQIYDERSEIVPSALDFKMLLLADVIDADMHFAPAWHRDRDFLAEKEIGVVPERLGAIDGIVVRDGDKVHAPLLQGAVSRLGIVVAFPANPLQDRDVAFARISRMDVQIALHASLVTRPPLRFDDSAKKHL